MERLRHMIKWQISVSIAVIFAISAIAYFYVTENLIKPATTQEAIHFLLEYPKEYLGALIFGGIAKIATLLMVVVSIGVTVRFVVDDFWEYSRRFALGYLVINWIATVLIIVLQRNIITYFWVLLEVVAVILFLVCLWMSSDK
ncbi:MAG: hypothetical protein HDR06_12090 [Lachnospiraceae bacterium]|nr:hypothetical protein [Lachnospiraceae bacterium]